MNELFNILSHKQFNKKKKKKNIQPFLRHIASWAVW